MQLTDVRRILQQAREIWPVGSLSHTVIQCSAQLMQEQQNVMIKCKELQDTRE